MLKSRKGEIMITIRITGKEATLFEKTGVDELYGVYKEEYKEGESIEVEFSNEGLYWISLDTSLYPALLWCKGKYKLPIPFGDAKLPYPPQSFSGSIHLIQIRKAKDEERLNYRNLALNPFDWHGNNALYPHSWANVETRGESVFASRNAIDGFIASDMHGVFPWSSWGINRNPDAEITIDFGRPVDIDKVVFYNRADFPHDAWWTEATVKFSDGEERIARFEKKDGAQPALSVNKKGITSLTVSKLIKADDPSPFPALVQLEVWGKECE